MFDFTNLSLYFDVLFTVFSVIIIFGVIIALPVGIWALRDVKKNLCGAVISFVLYFLTLLFLCYRRIGIRAFLYGSVASDIFLGAVIGFAVAIPIAVLRKRAKEEF